MAIEWSPDLETGINEIDDQHRSIFERINLLLASMKEGKGREEVGKMVGFLGDYVVTHFAAEEKQMEQFNYPNLAGHRSIHILFLNDFEKLRAQFEKEGPTVDLVLAVQRRVVDWLFDHIRKTDKVMAAHLRAQAQAGK